MFPLVSIVLNLCVPWLIIVRIQAVTIPKYSQEDTFFTTKNGKGENITVTVPKGTYLSINVPGLHYNRQFCSFPVLLTSDLSVTDVVGLSQPDTGKTLTSLIHLGSLVIGRVMHFFHLAVVSNNHNLEISPHLFFDQRTSWVSWQEVSCNHPQSVKPLTHSSR